MNYPNNGYYNDTCNFIGGHDNYQKSTTSGTPSMIFGSYNGDENNPITGSSIIFGNSNKNLLTMQPGAGVTIGNSNKLRSNGMIFGNGCSNETAQGAVKYMIGEGIKSFGSWNEKVMGIGLYNKNSGLLSNACFVVGCGTSDSARKNALEINNTQFKITNSLQLATDATEVNAITPPQDPNNVTQDDMTLATVSHLGGSYRKSQVAYFSDYDSATSIPTDGTSVDFTTFGAKPAWANRALVTFRWENELFEKEIHFTRNEGIHLYAVQQAYSTFPDTIEYKHLRVEWDYTNQTLTAAGFWTYSQDMANNGAISGWDRALTNASTCKILSVVYSE